MKRRDMLFVAILAMVGVFGSYMAARVGGTSTPPAVASAGVAGTAGKPAAGGSQPQVPPKPAACPYSQANQSPLASWLSLTPGQTSALERGEFASETLALNQKLQAERERLVALFEDPQAPDEALLQQVESVITAHDSLERHVARYVVNLRRQLPSEQQRRLMGLCANTVRGAGCCAGGCNCARKRGSSGAGEQVQPAATTPCANCPAAQ